MTLTTIDSCEAALHELRWSCGDMAFWAGHSMAWQVYAHKCDQRTLVRAGTQTEACEAALDQARKVVR